jgi:hypothetical protein
VICRTPEEAYAAGWEDGAEDAPLTQQEIEYLAVLHGPHLTIAAEAS